MLIDKFHNMEMDYRLFELDPHIPYWDILRYSVYLKYYYTENSQSNLKTYKNKHLFKDYLILFIYFLKQLFYILTKNYDNLILTVSRYYNKETKRYYDMSAHPFIKLANKNIIAVEMVMNKKVDYPFLCDFSNVFARLNKKVRLPYSVYTKIEAAVVSVMGENRLSYDELNYVYKIYDAEIKYYTLLLKKLHVKNVIICKGNPKAIIKVCRNMNITTTLVQHASIERDEVDYSYPDSISCENQMILFSDSVATFGSYWCTNVNVPVRNIITIGNDEMYNVPNLKCDNSFVVISSIIHGTELKYSAREIALSYPDRKVIYKLHPNEYHLKSEYIEFFRDVQNVRVIDIEDSTKNLVAKSSVVIAIVSAVVYDALHQGKIVAILQRINYRRQQCIMRNSNVFMYNTTQEFVSKFNTMIPKKNSLSYYECLKPDKVKKLLSGNF